MPATAATENGGEGNDTVFSSAHFALSANVENLVLQGGADLQGFGNGLANALFGNTGNNLLDGGAGADAMTGGAGNDIYFVDNAGDAVTESIGEGNDTVFSTAHFALSANAENLVLQGGADLQGFGNGLANALFGNTGNNLLDGGVGADAMSGGAGNDIYFVDNAGDAVNESVGEGNDTVFSTAHFALSANVDNLVLQGGADLQGYGNGLANSIFGNSGNNLLDGGAGADSMSGGAGNDIYFVDNAGDAVNESAGQGNDTVFSSAHFALSTNVENLVLQGGADLQGYGNGLANSIFGNSGNNLIDGGAGANSMSGGAGNDIYFVDNAGDVVTESAGQGNDAVFASINYGLTANVETLVQQGSADLQGFGNGLANSIFGNSGNNLIDGGVGADSMSGGAGNDIYFVDNAGDAVNESAGQGSDAVFASVNYGLTANIETLVMQGGTDLQGFGNTLANSIFGNAGNNLIDGGAGGDTMVGGTRQRHLLRRRRPRSGDRERGRWQRCHLHHCPLRAVGERGNAGAARLRRPGRHRQRARQRDLRQFRQQHGGRPGRRRHSHRQCRQRHLRVQCRPGQRRYRRGLRRQRGSSWRFAAVRRLRPWRDLHQHRCDPLADQLQRRHVARHHHVHECRIN